MEKYKILKTPCFRVSSIEEIKDYIKSLLKKRKGGYSVAINAEKIMMYLKDNEIKNIIDNSILPIPDGAGAVLGFKFLYGVNCIKVDLPTTILELANEERYKIFVLGATEEVNQKAVSKIKDKYPNINIVGRRNGYFKSSEEIVSLLKKTNPDIVLVALGSPKQEKFASEMNKIFPNVLFIGCGGALDVLAGKVKRAPKFFQENHLEWLYRLILQPKRIKRQKVLPIYFFKLLQESIRRKIK